MIDEGDRYFRTVYPKEHRFQQLIGIALLLLVGAIILLAIWQK